MRIWLHIGLPHTGAERIQSVLANKRDQLSQKGVRFAQSPGNKNHTRLFMAVTEPGHVDPLRFNRGYMTPAKQSVLRDSVQSELAREIDEHKPDALILSAAQLGASLVEVSELERLKALVGAFSDDIRVVAHVDEPAKLLLRHYAEQVMEGRGRTLDLEMSLAGGASWWRDCLKEMPRIDPVAGQFLETQTPAFWLDYEALVTHWESVFGAGSISLRAYDAAKFASPAIVDELRAAFEIEDQFGKAKATNFALPTPAAAVARGRQFNALVLRVLADRKRILPRQLWRQLVQEMAVEGEPDDPASLSAISKTFEAANARLTQKYDLPTGLFKRPRAKGTWTEADPTRGFRASQYLLQYMWRIDKATRQAQRAKASDLAAVNGDPPPAPNPKSQLSQTAKAIMPPLAVANFEKLTTSRFAPHNRIGQTNELEAAAAYTPMPPRKLPKGSSGRVIVGCMKNEAPYILEWVAYHRAIGVDNFLIYTNGCEDGTDEILDRLQELGLLQHRLNDEWKGKSPQQFALNKSLKEPVVRNAEWLIHIDVDEFMNVRCGNGTLDDFFALVPDATNVAMTWRLFGNNGVDRMDDDLVIAEFETCAPKFCPKPHTVWGFKTMFRNNGAYAKMSCHRPNKLDPDWKNRVNWVNGSGEDITGEMAERGWRSSMKSIGYDYLQLNHYALRSRESFLVKRQRGRALHVDRSIGLNYWVRMDWSVHRDITIQRNVPRVRAEFDRLLEDPVLSDWHEKGVAWHRAKAEELKSLPEFRELYEQVQKIELTEMERVAYALALDMES